MWSENEEESTNKKEPIDSSDVPVQEDDEEK